MKKRATALLLALLMILPMAGCGVRAQELTKDIEPQALDTTTDLTAGGEAVTAFALSLLRSERAAAEGVLISPVSVLNALGMVANGAGGDTLKQLETAAGMSLNQLNDFLYTYRMSLPAACKSCTVSLANSAWVREDFRVEDDFLRSCVNYYSAEIYRSAFDGGLVTDLNRWVSKKTDGMIDRLLEQAPDVLTMLYLVNAACFDARWDTPYTKADLRTGLPFTAANGTQQTADYLTGTESIYLSGNNVTGFVKPYDGGKYAFVALLPDEGVTLADYLENLTGEMMGALGGEEMIPTDDGAGDDEEDGRTATFPFLSKLSGNMDRQKPEQPKDGKEPKKGGKKDRRKFCGPFCAFLWRELPQADCFGFWQGN